MTQPRTPVVAICLVCRSWILFAVICAFPVFELKRMWLSHLPN